MVFIRDGDVFCVWAVGLSQFCACVLPNKHKQHFAYKPAWNCFSMVSLCQNGGRMVYWSTHFRFLFAADCLRDRASTGLQRNSPSSTGCLPVRHHAWWNHWSHQQGISLFPTKVYKKHDWLHQKDCLNWCIRGPWCFLCTLSFEGNSSFQPYYSSY